MFGAALLDSVALVIAAGALAAAGFTLTAVLAPAASGLARLLGAVVIAAALAVLEALILGRFGLGGSAIALTLLAVVTALGAAASARTTGTRRTSPTSPLGPLAELVVTLRSAGPLALAGVGALAGAVVALAAIELHRPVLGQDAITYHLPEVVGWVQSGHTGRVLDEFYGLPVGNYPVTEEVLLAWATGITHGFSAALLLTVATVPLLLAAGWLGLAELGVPRAVRGLALASLALVPLIVQAWFEPGTDLEAMTWLACCGALCLAARREPGLLVVAVLAAGLAVGTKTTVLSYSVVMLALTVWFRRADLRAHWRGLTGAAVLAILTGLIWYLRNWVDHGSPLWPFSSFPSGDPQPRIITYLSTSLLDNLRATLLDHLHGYVSGLSGGVVLVVIGVAAVVPAAVLRRRRLLIAGAVVAAGALEYAAGPVTGLPPHGTLLVAVVGSTLRYLMPVFAAGAVVLALTASDPNRWLAGAGRVALAATVVWDLISDLPHDLFLGFDYWLWPGIVIGALGVLALGWGLGHLSGLAVRTRTTLGIVSATAVAVVAALVLAVGSTHFAFRHAITADYAQGVSIFLLTQPGYTDSDVPVATSRTGLAQLAGDRLQHPITLIPVNASCAQVERDHSHDWIVIGLPLPAAVRREIPAGVSPADSAPGCLARAGVSPEYQDSSFAVYKPLKT